MLLNCTRSGRAALGRAAIMALLWPAVALAQAQVEAVPEPPPAFDPWNLDAPPDPIQLPGDEAPPDPPPSLGSVDADQPRSGANASDPCRHFTEEERRLLPSLCGASD
jgi:hypothetical protein